MKEKEKQQEEAASILRPGLWTAQTFIWPEAGLLKVRKRTAYQYLDWIQSALPSDPNYPLSALRGPVSHRTDGCSAW